MAKLVAFNGRAGSGKTTAAQALIEIGFKPMKIAYPMKQMLRAFYEACDVPKAEIERRIEGDLKRHPCGFLGAQTPTYAMQTLGGEWGRDLMDEYLWLRPTINKIEECLGQGVSVVIDDIRYQNEVDLLSQFGDVVRMVRPDLEMGEHHSHQSERPLLTPFTFNNDGTLGQLRAGVLKLFGETDANR